MRVVGLQQPARVRLDLGHTNALPPELVPSDSRGFNTAEEGQVAQAHPCPPHFPPAHMVASCSIVTSGVRYLRLSAADPCAMRSARSLRHARLLG